LWGKVGRKSFTSPGYTPTKQEIEKAMNHQKLLDKLIRIERAIGVEDNLTLQKMLMDAEESLLALEKERVQTLRRDVSQSALSGFQNESSSFALRPDAHGPVLVAAKTKARERA
jgi:hypothetical protein